MAAKMTPLEFAEKYLHLDVYLYPQELNGNGPRPPYVPPTGWQRLQADNYRLGHSAWRNTFWNSDIAPQFRKGPVEVCVYTIRGATEEVVFRSEAEAFSHFYPPFVGKGSPEQVQIAIQLVYRFRRVTTPVEQFVQRDFVGLDCNGFVGNYYRKVIQGESWRVADVDRDPGPTTWMSGLHQLGTEMRELKDLTPDGTYILTWCYDNGVIIDPEGGKYGHVMITQPGTLKGAPGGQTIKVVEATPPKLRSIDYTIRSGKNGVFFVERGSPKDTMYVRVCRLEV